MKMKLLLDLFSELGYEKKGEIRLDDSVGNDSFLCGDVYCSKMNTSQVFLIANCDNEKLRKMVEDNIIQRLAIEYRKMELYREEMNKNTQLIFVSKCQSNQDIDKETKIVIEDDPYYFKKYVLSYTEKGREAADEYLKDNQKDSSLIECIQKALLELNASNNTLEKQSWELAYDFFVEIATKVIAFPIEVVGEHTIKSVSEYLTDIFVEEEISFDEKMIKNIIAEWDISDIDLICDSWRDYKKEAEGLL